MSPHRRVDLETVRTFALLAIAVWLLFVVYELGRIAGALNMLAGKPS